MTATAPDRYVNLPAGTQLFPLTDYGLADRSRPMTIDAESYDNPVVGQYAGYAIVRFEDGEDYAVTLRDLGYLQTAMVLDPRPAYTAALVDLEAAAVAAIEALDAAGTHEEPSDEPDEFGIVASDFVTEPR